MKAKQLLDQLNQHGVLVSIKDSNLFVSTHEGTLTYDLVKVIQGNKAGLMNLLSSPLAVPTHPQLEDVSKGKPPDTTDTPEGRGELEALLEQYPEARPVVSGALDKGAWFGNCIGAMQQWALGDPEYAKEILNEWVVYWKGYPENYEALLEEARKAFNTGK
jgi:hypothetical protein